MEKEVKKSVADRIKLWKTKKILKMKEKNKNCYLKKKLSNETKQPKQETLSMTNSAVKKRKERKDKKEKREKETKRKQSYRKSAKKTAAIEQIFLYRKTFVNRTEKSRALKKLKQSLPLTPNRRTAVMASYLSSKKSPTVFNLEKMNVVVTPEDKNDIHLGKAVIHDLREIVDKTKLLRTDGARTAISIITASTNGSNVQNEKKKVLLAKKIGLPVKRISGGKNVRAKILSSEESCWKYIQRKTRKDAISPEIKKIAYDFWLHPDNSRPSPNKTDIKRVRIAPKQFSKHTIHILDKTQTEIFHEFKIKYPEISMNQRTFERLKPFFVRAASPKDRLTCCCRYHVEAKSLFLKCMEFRKKHIHPQLSEEEKNKFPVYEHLTDIAVATLCGKDKTHDCFNKVCLDRKCTECGVRLLDFSDQELNDHPEAPTVNWEKYEYITVHNKRKLTLVRKCSKPSEMFAHFKHVLDHFAGHQFRAYWQNAQLKSLKENLPQNNCIVIHDYSENYACKERVEVQSTYFQRTEVTIHVSIIYRHSVLELDGVESFPDDPCIVTEHFFVISSDEKHDQCFTSKVQSLVKEYLDSISYNVNVFHEFTDGCPVQYKSRNCFGTLRNICVENNYDLFIRNYFETSHAKGPQDAAGGFLKNHVDLAVLRGSAVVQNAHDFFNYCEKNLKDTKSHYCKRRIFRFVETINRDSVKAYKPIPGIRSLHQVLNSEPEKLTVRYMSCYSCEECVTGNYNMCTNNAIGRKEIVPIRPDDKGTIDDDENDNEYTMSDLIVEGTVLALYTDEENAEFYLLRASSCPEKLRTSEVDDWGVSFRKNTKIIRGQYFKSDLNRSELSYKLIRRKKAIVPEASVIYIAPQLRVNSRFALTLPETVHLDILSVLDEMES